MLGQAFDEAWAEIAGKFGSNPSQVENARLRLAEALLSVATEESTDVAALKRGALQAMALDYKSGARPTYRSDVFFKYIRRCSPVLGKSVPTGDDAQHEIKFE